MMFLSSMKGVLFIRNIDIGLLIMKITHSGNQIMHSSKWCATQSTISKGKLLSDIGCYKPDWCHLHLPLCTHCGNPRAWIHHLEWLKSGMISLLSVFSNNCKARSENMSFGRVKAVKYHPDKNMSQLLSEFPSLSLKFVHLSICEYTACPMS